MSTDGDVALILLSDRCLGQAGRLKQGAECLILSYHVCEERTNSRTECVVLSSYCWNFSLVSGII
jgi:hypothetical protein